MVEAEWTALSLLQSKFLFVVISSYSQLLWHTAEIIAESRGLLAGSHVIAWFLLGRSAAIMLPVWIDTGPNLWCSRSRSPVRLVVLAML